MKKAALIIISIALVSTMLSSCGALRRNSCPTTDRRYFQKHPE